MGAEGEAMGVDAKPVAMVGGEWGEAGGGENEARVVAAEFADGGGVDAVGGMADELADPVGVLGVVGEVGGEVVGGDAEFGWEPEFPLGAGHAGA